MRQKYKVVMVAPLPPPNGGITNWYKIVSKHAKKKGIKVINIDSSPKIQNRSLFHRIFIQGFSMLKLTHQLRNSVKKEHPSVVHVCSSGSLAIFRDVLMLICSKKLHTRTVYHLHFGRVPELRAFKNWEWNLLLLAIRLANATITMDLISYDILKDEFGSEKIFYVPNPVDIPMMEYSKSSEKVVLFSGWVVKTKGIEELLSAWSLVNKDFPDWYLHIMGPITDQYNEFIKQNFNLKNITFLGYVEHDIAIKKMAECDLFVLPSYSEGCPNVILEAMACGKPIISTNVGAIPTLLSNFCGIIIEPKKTVDLAEAMRNIMSNEHQRQIIGDNAKKKAISEYQIDVIFSKYEEIWYE